MARNGSAHVTTIDNEMLAALTQERDETRWWAVTRGTNIFGPFRARHKAVAWAHVYHGRVVPMLPPDIDNERTYEATRSPGPGR